MTQEMKRAEISAKRNEHRVQELQAAIRGAEKRTASSSRDEAQAAAAFAALERQHEREKGEWYAQRISLEMKVRKSSARADQLRVDIEQMKSEHDQIVGLLERKVALERERNAVLVTDADEVSALKVQSESILEKLSDELVAQREILQQTREELVETQTRQIDLVRLTLENESATINGIETFVGESDSESDSSY